MYNDSATGLLFVSCQSLLNGTDTINGIFTFDGSEFVSLAKERYDCGNVNCGPALFLTRYDGDIYYSGPGVERIDSIYLNGIGKWDGEKWSAEPIGLGGNVFDKNPFIDGYCIHDGKLYVSGFFRTAEGDTCNSVAYWDGQHWTGLNFPGDGFFGETPRVNHVFFYKDELYAAGNFYLHLDGEWIADIVRYDGTNWHAVGGGLHGGQADIWDWAIYKDELYICGYFRKIDGNVGNKIMRWDGEQWKDVGGGVCSPAEIAHGLTVYDGKLLLSGIFDCVGNGLPVSNIAAWDGERWCSFGNSTFDNSIASMAEYKGEIYIGGGFTEVDGQPCRYFAKWVGDHATDTCSALVSDAPEISGNRGEFRLWPNPVGEELHIESAGSIERVQIFDCTGKVVKNAIQTISGTKEESFTVDTRLLTSGLYYVTFQSSGRTHSGKFVKI